MGRLKRSQLEMKERLTVLWLVDPARGRSGSDGTLMHVLGNPARPGATITRLIALGPVLAVVEREEVGRQALAYGVDEVVLADELEASRLDVFVDRTMARARGRMMRDLHLIDLVRNNDTDALGLLAAALGRELLAPLARVCEETRELLDEPASGSAPSSDRVKAIVESVESMTRFVERTQAWLDDKPTDEVVDLVQVVRAVADPLALGLSGIAALRVVVPPHRCLVSMPRRQVAMVIANLVANAAQSISARGVRPGEIRIEVSEEEGAVALEVTDNGIGMAPGVRVQANDLFYTTERERRLGLGLTLATSRVRRAGGEVVIDSDPGNGTTVRVFLPLLQMENLPRNLN